jgi:peptide/nickel transport system substrate-binding protein
MKKIIWLVLSSLIVLSLVLSSCGGEEEEEEITIPETEEELTVPEEEEEVTVPEEEKGPQYGGTFTYRMTKAPSNFDPYLGVASGILSLWMERPATRDWSVDRNIFDHKTRFTPTEYTAGMLAESWELTPDFLTCIFHIRKGVYWHDKPPVNGREFTADDMEYFFHRFLGLGSGYTEPSPYTNVRNYATIKSVAATDKYTLVFEFKEPSLQQLEMLISDATYNMIGTPRESIEQWGDLNDWEHAIGTGPFMLVDFVADSSLTAVRNPNYWGYDDFYPENRLPYVDKVKILIIPDESTALAALRTGKISLMENLSWEIAGNIAKTNPELLQVTRPQDAPCIMMLVDKEPFNDFRVRRAMQMAIDLKTIAETYYGGTIDGTPMGLVGHKGYYTPFDEWPQEVKDGYIYNPEGAKKLLAESGYPDGFKCTLTAQYTDDLDLYQIIQAYLSDIGVYMEIEVFEPSTFKAYTSASKHEMATNPNTGTTCINPARMALNYRYSGHSLYNTHHINDPIFEEYYNKAQAALSQEELRNIIIEADMYATSQQWVVNVLPTTSFCIYQPWLRGFNGENTINVYGETFKWFWIDQDLMKEMGR